MDRKKLDDRWNALEKYADDSVRMSNFFIWSLLFAASAIAFLMMAAFLR